MAKAGLMTTNNVKRLFNDLDYYQTKDEAEKHGIIVGLLIEEETSRKTALKTNTKTRPLCSKSKTM